MKEKLIITLIAIAVFCMTVTGQVPSSAGSIITVDFDNTVSGVNNGAFDGTLGFASAPGVGQLDTDAFRVEGLSDGNTVFGQATATGGDFDRGNSVAGGVTTGGIYNFGPTGTLGVQPGGSDFTPGNITLRIENTAATPMTAVTISYRILANNDQSRANSLNFSYSENDVAYTPVAALNYTSTETADALGFVSAPRFTRISGINIAAGGFFYIRWTGDDVSGAGSRDEFALDDIIINRLAPTAAAGTISGRALNSSGSGIKFVSIMLSGGDLSEPIYVTTNHFGFYRFEDLPVGRSYVLQVISRKYSFRTSSILVNLDDNIFDLDFVTLEPGGVNPGKGKSFVDRKN